MTPDDTTPDDVSPADAPLAGDDAIARAARDGLRRLAGSHAPVALDWDRVQAGARRVRQRRVAAVVAACAIVIATAGAAVAATGRDRDRVSIAGRGRAHATTTTESPTTTSTSATSTTIATPAAAVDGGPPTPVPDALARPALPTDLTGTITLASTTWHVGQTEPVTLTVRNASDHPIVLPVGVPAIGVYIDYLDNIAWGTPDGDPTLNPGQERTFTATMNPGPESIGATRISAAFVRGIVMDVGGTPDPFLPGVPSVPISIVPPNWTPALALDPAMGKWKAVMSADAADAAANGSVAVHARVTNVGDQTQEAEAYGSLAIVCSARDGNVQMQRVGLATMAPGDEVTFSFDYSPAPDEAGPVSCSVRMTFPSWDDASEPHAGLDTDSVTFTVVPTSTTTTTTPGPTTTSAP